MSTVKELAVLIKDLHNVVETSSTELGTRITTATLSLSDDFNTKLGGVVVEIGKVSEDISKIDVKCTELEQRVQAIASSQDLAINNVTEQISNLKLEVSQGLQKCQGNYVECSDSIAGCESRIQNLEQTSVNQSDFFDFKILTKASIDNCIQSCADSYAKSVLASEKVVEIHRQVSSHSVGIEKISSQLEFVNSRVDSLAKDLVQLSKGSGPSQSQSTVKIKPQESIYIPLHANVSPSVTDTNHTLPIPEYEVHELGAANTDDPDPTGLPHTTSIQKVPEFSTFPLRTIKLSDLKNLEVFDGSIERKLPATYIRDVVDDLIILGIPRSQYLSIFKRLMRNSARVWFETNCEYFRSFDDFYQAFIEHFQSDSVRVHRLAQVYNRRYDAQEGSILDFFWKRVDEFKNLSPNLSCGEIISSIISTLPYRYRSFLIGRPYRSMEEFAEILQDIEAYLPETSRWNSPASNPNVTRQPAGRTMPQRLYPTRQVTQSRVTDCRSPTGNYSRRSPDGYSNYQPSRSRPYGRPTARSQRYEHLRQCDRNMRPSDRGYRRQMEVHPNDQHTSRRAMSHESYDRQSSSVIPHQVSQVSMIHANETRTNNPPLRDTTSQTDNDVLSPFNEYPICQVSFDLLNRSGDTVEIEEAVLTEEDRKEILTLKKQPTSRIMVRVDKERVETVLDTGSVCSLMSLELWQRLGSQIKNPRLRPATDVRLIDYSGMKKTKVMGRVSVFISIESLEVATEVFVLRNLSVPLLLGSDFLCNTQAIIKYTDQSVEFKSPTGQIITRMLPSQLEETTEEEVISEFPSNFVAYSHAHTSPVKVSKLSDTPLTFFVREALRDPSVKAPIMMEEKVALEFTNRTANLELCQVCANPTTTESVLVTPSTDPRVVQSFSATEILNSSIEDNFEPSAHVRTSNFGNTFAFRPRYVLLCKLFLALFLCVVFCAFSWSVHLETFVHLLNNSYCDSIGTIPAELHLNAQVSHKILSLLGIPPVKTNWPTFIVSTRPCKVYPSRVKRPTIKQSDLVFVKTHRQSDKSKKQIANFFNIFEGPCYVTQVIGPSVFEIYNCNTGRKLELQNIDNVKLWQPSTEKREMWVNKLKEKGPELNLAAI